MFSYTVRLVYLFTWKNNTHTQVPKFLFSSAQKRFMPKFYNKEIIFILVVFIFFTEGELFYLALTKRSCLAIPLRIPYRLVLLCLKNIIAFALSMLDEKSDCQMYINTASTATFIPTKSLL